MVSVDYERTRDKMRTMSRRGNRTMDPIEAELQAIILSEKARRADRRKAGLEEEED